MLERELHDAQNELDAVQEEKRRIDAQNDQQRKEIRSLTIELNTLKGEAEEGRRESTSTSRRNRDNRSGYEYQPKSDYGDSRADTASDRNSVVLYNKRPPLPKRDTQTLPTVGVRVATNAQAIARFSYEGSRDFNSSPMHKGTKMTVIKYNDAKDWALVSFDGMTTWEPVSYLEVEEEDKTRVMRPRSQHVPSVEGASSKRRGLVIANFDGIDKSEMSVQKGEIVQVLKEEGEWLLGTVGTRVGEAVRGET